MAFKVKLPTIWIGAAYKKVFRWYSEDDNGARTPIDLTGMNGRIQLRRKAGDATVLADWSTDNGHLVLSDVNRICIVVPASVTEKYNFKTAEWDFLIWPGASVDEAETLMYGEVEGRKTVTDAVP